MRIVIDARYVNDHFPGIGRYVYNLLSALGELATLHTFAVLYNPDLSNTRYEMSALARHTSIRLVATRLRPFSLAEQAKLPRLLRSLQADLFHATYYVRPYFGLPCPSVTTLYDTIPRLFPAEVSPRARLMFSLLMARAAYSSRHILAISASARQDLSEAFRIRLGASPSPRLPPIGALRRRLGRRSPRCEPNTACRNATCSRLARTSRIRTWSRWSRPMPSWQIQATREALVRQVLSQQRRSRRS